MTYLVALMYGSVTLQTVMPPDFKIFNTFSLFVVFVMAEMSRTTHSDIASFSFYPVYLLMWFKGMIFFQLQGGFIGENLAVKLLGKRQYFDVSASHF